MENDLCPLCLRKGKKRKLKFLQVNYTEALLSCLEPQCVYPCSPEIGNFVYILRDPKYAMGRKELLKDIIADDEENGKEVNQEIQGSFDRTNNGVSSEPYDIEIDKLLGIDDGLTSIGTDAYSGLEEILDEHFGGLSLGTPNVINDASNNPTVCEYDKPVVERNAAELQDVSGAIIVLNEEREASQDIRVEVCEDEQVADVRSTIGNICIQGKTVKNKNSNNSCERLEMNSLSSDAWRSSVTKTEHEPRTYSRKRTTRCRKNVMKKMKPEHDLKYSFDDQYLQFTLAGEKVKPVRKNITPKSTVVRPSSNSCQISLTSSAAPSFRLDIPVSFEFANARTTQTNQTNVCPVASRPSIEDLLKQHSDNVLTSNQLKNSVFKGFSFEDALTSTGVGKKISETSDVQSEGERKPGRYLKKKKRSAKLCAAEKEFNSEEEEEDVCKTEVDKEIAEDVCKTEVDKEIANCVEDVCKTEVDEQITNHVDEEVCN